MSAPNQINPQPEAASADVVDPNDPFSISYPESAARFALYRIAIVIFAVFMIIIGKSNLPADEVSCIEDVIINGLQPVTNFYINNPGLGLTLISIAQLIVDLQLIGMLIYWFFLGNSLRYPILLLILGISKILLNTKLIDNSFSKQVFPSFAFGQNFVNTYFFSGIICFLMYNLLELYQQNHKKLFFVQIGLIIYELFILLSMRLNYFMDVVTGLVFAHFVFYFIHERKDEIDGFFFKIYDKIVGNQQKYQQNELKDMGNRKEEIK